MLKKIIYILIIIVFFSVTYIVDSTQIIGDVTSYRFAYERLKEFNIIDGFSSYQGNLSSSDIASYTLTWFAAQTIDRVIFLCSLNASLALLIYLYFRSKGKSLVAYLSIIPFNFYFLVLLFSAERLKISFIFLLLAILTTKNIIFTFFAFLAHSQSTILVISMNAYGACGLLKNKISKAPLKSLLIIIPLISTLFLNLEYYYWKISSYTLLNKLNLNDFYFLYISYVFILFKNRGKLKKSILIEFLLYNIFLLFLGSDRINILIYSSYIMHTYFYSKKIDLLFIIVSIYFNIKGLIFLIEITSGRIGFG